MKAAYCVPFIIVASMSGFSVYAQNPSYYVPGSTTQDYEKGNKYDLNENSGIYNIHSDKYGDVSPLTTPYDGPSSEEKSRFLLSIADRYPEIKNALKEGRNINFSALTDKEKSEIISLLGKSDLFVSTSDTMFGYTQNRAVQDASAKHSADIQSAILTTPFTSTETLKLAGTLASLSAESLLDVAKLYTGKDIDLRGRKAGLYNSIVNMDSLKKALRFIEINQSLFHIGQDALTGEYADLTIKDGVIENIDKFIGKMKRGDRESVIAYMSLMYDLSKVLISGVFSTKEQQEEATQLLIDLTLAGTNFAADTLPDGPVSGRISALLSYADKLKKAWDTGTVTAEKLGIELTKKTDEITAQYQATVNQILSEKLTTIVYYNLNSSTPRAIELAKNQNPSIMQTGGVVSDNRDLKNTISSITQGSNSHIGAANLFAGRSASNSQNSSLAVVDPLNTTNVPKGATTNPGGFITGGDQTDGTIPGERPKPPPPGGGNAPSF